MMQIDWSIKVFNSVYSSFTNWITAIYNHMIKAKAINLHDIFSIEKVMIPSYTLVSLKKNVISNLNFNQLEWNFPIRAYCGMISLVSMV